MKKSIAFILAAAMVFTMAACASEQNSAVSGQSPTAEQSGSVVSSILVNRIEGLSEEFIMGADVSSLISLEASGVSFYDFDGNAADPLKTMSEAGVNCIRVRVWNEPFDAAGNGYGGGNCTIDTAIELGKRAAQYGMELLVDFHYSDFWADPSKQQAPKAWAGMSVEEKTQAIYDYTANCLQKLSDAGVPVKMVQIGNETTNGICGETSVPRVMSLMASAAKAVRDTDPGILIAVHYTNPESVDFNTKASLLKVNGVDYDVFASSYYPYWHGTLENLKAKLSQIAEDYGKQVMVAEVSWAYTIEELDGHGNTIGEELSYEKPYPFTVQGQANCIADVIKSMAEIGGIGVFYWEPAWLPVPGESWEERSELWEQHGSGWASSYSAEYDPNDAGLYYGGSACDNQALFDAEGHPLESLRVFSYVRSGTKCELKVDSIEPCYISVKCNNPITLPETASAVYNDGTEAEVEVVWDDTELDAISASPVGVYPVTGRAGEAEVICYVSMVEENYVLNHSFEDGDYSMWRITDIAAAPQTDFQIKSTDAYAGEVSLHYWNENAVEFTVEQDITGLRSGKYRFSLQAQGGDHGDDAICCIYAIADGVRYEAPFSVEGWRVWQTPSIEDIICESGEITIGIYVKTAGGGWGTVDELLLNPME